MAKPLPEKALKAIEKVVAAHPEGIAFSDINKELGKPITYTILQFRHDEHAPVPAPPESVNRSTLQFHLRYLVDKGRIAMKGEKRWARYFPPASARQEPGTFKGQATGNIQFSRQGEKIQQQVRLPVNFRKPAGFQRTFLDRYKPNDSAYLSKNILEHLRKTGASPLEGQAAGAHAKKVITKLLVDLSWSSSRLEGNTYTLLDTKRLIDFGEMAEGKDQLEAQMILNHKHAIEFLVDNADQIKFNRATVLNLHALLSNNLLGDPAASGRLRNVPVSIGKSVYYPPEIPQLIEECFDQVLATAAAIKNPFEQSFFVMAHLPYLQPFEDVNKRTSRLAANIPLIKENLVPLSFVDVSESDYTEAILGVYELNKIELLRDVFVWAYERSAQRLAIVSEIIGPPDLFRSKHRKVLYQVTRDIVIKSLDRKQAFAYIADWASKNVDDSERSQFREVVEEEVMALHAGNYTRYDIQPADFQAWQEVWNE